MEGPLDQDVAHAGAGFQRGLQREITRQRELVEHDRLHRDFMRLQSEDPMRMAWLAADRSSTAVVPVWPSPQSPLAEREMFTTVRCFMLGVALPALDVEGIAGADIPDSHQGRRRVCDVYGLQLGLATLPGDDWRRAWHDPMVRLLESHAERAGVPILREPRALFAHVLDHDMLGRRHLGIVPDLVPTMSLARDAAARGRSTQLLFDAKTLWRRVAPTTWRRAGSASVRVRWSGVRGRCPVTTHVPPVIATALRRSGG